MNPKLVMLEGYDEKLAEMERYLGRELTEYDLQNPELMGAGWIKIIRGVGKGLKAIGRGIGKRHRRKEAGRVAAARSRMILQRKQKRDDYLENLRLQNYQQQYPQPRSITQQQIKKANLNKSILYIGAPLFIGFVYWQMTKD